MADPPVPRAVVPGRRHVDKRERSRGRRQATTGPRRDDPTSTLPRHRLLAYLGRDIRELQLQLAGGSAPVADEARAGLAGSAGGRSRATLLARLQDDLSEDRPARAMGGPNGDGRPVLNRDDTSVQLHVSHGPDRQVEVLREVLLGLLDDDPTLEPRDIVVLCPDIETFAPLIAATFGLDSSAAQQADRPRTPAAPSIPGTSSGSGWPIGRCAGSIPCCPCSTGCSTSPTPGSRRPPLLDLASTPPVARRFGFSEDELQRLTELVAGLWSALGARRPAAWPVRSGVVRPEHVGSRSGPDTAGSHDGLRGRVLHRHRAAAGPGRFGRRRTGRADRRAGGAASPRSAGPVTGIDRRPLSWWMDACREALESLTAVPADRRVAERSRVRRAGPACRAGRPGPP